MYLNAFVKIGFLCDTEIILILYYYIFSIVVSIARHVQTNIDKLKIQYKYQLGTCMLSDIVWGILLYNIFMYIFITTWLYYIIDDNHIVGLRTVSDIFQIFQESQ